MLTYEYKVFLCGDIILANKTLNEHGAQGYHLCTAAQHTVAGKMLFVMEKACDVADNGKQKQQSAADDASKSLSRRTSVSEEA